MTSYPAKLTKGVHTSDEIFYTLKWPKNFPFWAISYYSFGEPCILSPLFGLWRQHRGEEVLHFFDKVIMTGDSSENGTIGRRASTWRYLRYVSPNIRSRWFSCQCGQELYYYLSKTSRRILKKKNPKDIIHQALWIGHEFEAFSVSGTRWNCLREKRFRQHQKFCNSHILHHAITRASRISCHLVAQMIISNREWFETISLYSYHFLDNINSTVRFHVDEPLFSTHIRAEIKIARYNLNEKIIFRSSCQVEQWRVSIHNRMIFYYSYKTKYYATLFL